MFLYQSTVQQDKVFAKKEFHGKMLLESNIYSKQLRTLWTASGKTAKCTAHVMFEHNYNEHVKAYKLSWIARAKINNTQLYLAGSYFDKSYSN